MIKQTGKSITGNTVNNFHAELLYLNRHNDLHSKKPKVQAKERFKHL